MSMVLDPCSVGTIARPRSNSAARVFASRIQSSAGEGSSDASAESDRLRHLFAERGFPRRIDAPGACAGEEQIKENEAIDHRFVAAVEQRNDALAEMRDEISCSHFA